MSSNQIYIVSAVRSPVGNFLGSLSKIPASELGSVVIKEVIRRANIESNEVAEVIMGQALSAGQGQNPARQAALKAGLPIESSAYTINMLCGSGLKSVYLGYQSIKCGDSHIVVCGGQENMSLSPHCMYFRSGVKMGNTSMIDTMLNDGLTDAMHNVHMGETAENLAKEYSITREEQDAYATRSQNLTELSQKNGYFDKEIIPIETMQGKNKITVSTDEFPRAGTTKEMLSKLRPCFIKDGTVTPGNASGINDSAAAVLLMSEEEIKKRGATPLARIVAFAQAGVEPIVMGIGPVPAVNKVIEKAGWKKDEVDLFELNEAFAAQAIACTKSLNIDLDKVNVNGGAIAIGHPIGASGARILVTLIYALQRIGGKKGIASLCIGGGMGIAIAIELV